MMNDRERPEAEPLVWLPRRLPHCRFAKSGSSVSERSAASRARPCPLRQRHPGAIRFSRVRDAQLRPGERELWIPLQRLLEVFDCFRGVLASEPVEEVPGQQIE